jgi:hypothetical protein
MDGYVAAKKRIFAPASAIGATAIVGIDDAICRDIAEELRRDGNRRGSCRSRHTSAPGGVYAEDGRLIDALEGTPVTRFRPRRGAAPAGRAQRAECRRRLCRGAAAGSRPTRRRDRRHPHLPRPRASSRTGRYDRRGTLYQRFEGHQRRRHRKGARVLQGDLLDRRRSSQGRRHHLARALLRALAARLSDRQRNGGVRGDARRLGSHTPAAATSRPPWRRRPTGRARACPGRGRAVVAGLRLLRPVPQFRGARRHLPPARRRAAGSASGDEVRPRRSKPGRALVVDRRPLEPRRADGADRDRRGAEHGGEPRRRGAHRLRPAAFRQTPLWRRCRSSLAIMFRGVAAAAAQDPPRRLCAVRRLAGRCWC